VDVDEVHLSGPLKFVSQMSIFCVLHAWTISKSTRGDLFPAGKLPLKASSSIQRAPSSALMYNGEKKT
jgi:hypothetical protein